ncbi:hypothetical protein [Aerosticca soli]|jgi:uncharacterized protein YhdP|uniref:Uncharacterized protein n=1 Tax=Aerosticca soli TaxID=2010829 RepID=A0A2Z6E6V0_9GAMM|nr:hypothetical protein [Aerosticca soli]BBD80896.1 hypothetical protein ALSL_2270 [Aerosticca soli]
MPATATTKPSRSPLRRLGRELLALVLAKLVLLTLFGWALMALFPRTDTHPSAIEHHLAPATSSHGVSQP